MTLPEKPGYNSMVLNHVFIKVYIVLKGQKQDFLYHDKNTYTKTSCNFQASVEIGTLTFSSFVCIFVYCFSAN